MCVLEKVSSNPHVHFQGYHEHSDSNMKKLMADLSAKHYSREMYPEGRPLKRARKEVDEMGFQYISKEKDNHLFVQGFTDAELEELHRLSDEYVQEKKSGLREHLFERKYSGTAEEVHKKMRHDAFKYYVELDKQFPPRIQKDVLGIMYRHPQATPTWEAYVEEKH